MEYCRKLYHSILNQYGISTENSLIQNKHHGFYRILKCKKDRDNPEREIPGSVVIGGVEILAGALVWILPFPGVKKLGTGMILDGVRRTFDGVNEKGKDNEKKQHL